MNMVAAGRGRMVVGVLGTIVYANSNYLTWQAGPEAQLGNGEMLPAGAMCDYNAYIYGGDHRKRNGRRSNMSRVENVPAFAVPSVDAVYDQMTCAICLESFDLNARSPRYALCVLL